MFCFSFPLRSIFYFYLSYMHLLKEWNRSANLRNSTPFPISSLKGLHLPSFLDDYFGVYSRSLNNMPILLLGFSGWGVISWLSTFVCLDVWVLSILYPTSQSPLKTFSFRFIGFIFWVTPAARSLVHSCHLGPSFHCPPGGWGDGIGCSSSYLLFAVSCFFHFSVFSLIL